MLEITEALLDDPDQSVLEFAGFHKVFIRAVREPLRFYETPKLSVQQFAKPCLFLVILFAFLSSSPHCLPLLIVFLFKVAALPRGNSDSVPRVMTEDTMATGCSGRGWSSLPSCQAGAWVIWVSSCLYDPVPAAILVGKPYPSIPCALSVLSSLQQQAIIPTTILRQT